MNKKELIAGIDIDGSHITAGLVDIKKRSVVEGSIIRERVDCHADADTILTAWCRVIKLLWHKSDLPQTPLGFAMPGPFDYMNGICLINGLDKYESLYGMDIRSALAERLGIEGKMIAFRNDAEAFLEGELFCGAALGYRHAIGITLGTGLGSAYSHDGSTHDAALSVMEYQDDIIEAFVSTRAITGKYLELSGIKLKDAKAVADLYETDLYARKTYQQFATDLSWFLEYFIRREQPQVLVVGGNIASSWDLFMYDVIKNLSESLSSLPKIVKAKLGENAALIGGACCFNGKRAPDIPLRSDKIS